MRKSSRLLLAISLFISAHSANAAPHRSKLDRVFGLVPPTSFLDILHPDDTAPHATTGSFDQALDHSNPSDSRTFAQRYYIYSGYAKGPEAPVFYYICGEAECTDRFLQTHVGELARQFGAHLVSLEHRYYGKSQPFPTFTVENLRYLTTANALEDLAAFQRHAVKHLGLAGKWVVIGGSYAGNLSAYYRLIHPELAVASIAASAPVEARNEFPEFDRHATEAAGKPCADAVRSVIAQAEASLSDPVKLAAMKELFAAPALTDDDDFLYLVADLAAEAMQYGKRADFCAKLQGGDALAGYHAYVLEDLAADHATDTVSYTPQAGLELAATPDNNARPWYYQSCTEYGYWQTADADPELSMRSKRTNMAYQSQVCDRLFGIKQLADNAAMNARYYERLISDGPTSRIAFTNGSDDPWSELSVNPLRLNNHNPANENILIFGTAHCTDLHAAKPDDPPQLTQTRKVVADDLVKWLQD